MDGGCIAISEAKDAETFLRTVSPRCGSPVGEEAGVDMDAPK